MSMRKRLNTSQWIVATILALLVFLVLAIGVSFITSAYQYYQSSQRLEPQIARLKGLAESEQIIATAASASADQLAGLVYPADAELGALGNNMQQAMRQLFAQAGVVVSGSQVLPVIEQEYFNRVRVRLNATAEIEPLVELLQQLTETTPVVVIDKIEVKPKRRRKAGEQELDIDMVLSSFVQI